MCQNLQSIQENHQIHDERNMAQKYLPTPKIIQNLWFSLWKLVENAVHQGGLLLLFSMVHHTDGLPGKLQKNLSLSWICEWMVATMDYNLCTIRKMS